MIVIVPCPSCQGEGFNVCGQAWDGSDKYDGLCLTCDGRGDVEEDHPPRTLMDLEQEDFDMLEAKAK